MDITPDNAPSILDSLRWHEDMVITNYSGEMVWLKPIYSTDGRRIGITDCCPSDHPCEWHESLTALGITRLRPN